MLIELIKSVALLLVVSQLQYFIGRRWPDNELPGQIISGLLFAAICIVSMAPPINAHSDIILDAHSAILVVAGFSGGPFVGLLAALLTASYSVWTADGITIEIGIIATSVLMGLAYRYGLSRHWMSKGVAQYFALGVLVQTLTMAWLFYGTSQSGNLLNLETGFVLVGIYALSTTILAWMLEDIKQRLKTEKDLRKSDRRSRAIFDQTFEFIGLMTIDGTLIECNRTSLAFAGKPLSSVIGKPFWETPWWAHSITARQQLRNAIKQAAMGELVRFETTNAAPDGGFIYLDFSIKPTFNRRGDVEFLVSEGRDISIRKNLTARLHHSQRMEAVGQLTGSISHHFNNLFTVITGHAEALEPCVENDKTNKKHLATLMRNVDRAATLTHRLLSFSRRQALKPTVTILNAQIATSLDKIEWALGSNITVETQLSQDLWPTSLDQQQFDKAMFNLIQNAKDAMQSGGTLRIRTANFTAKKGQPKKHIYGPEPGDYVMVSITDTGIGISPQLQEKVFEPFFTTKDVGKGSGLGLSMVHGFIKQSRGYITLESEPNSGSIVRLYMPRFLDEKAAVSRVPDPVDA